MRKSISRMLVAVGLAGALAMPSFAAAATWQIDPQHASAQFAVKHLMISTVKGEFHGVNGTVVWDDKDVTKSSVDVAIDTTTVDTREPKRDEHLKSDGFLDVAKYPKMTFKSKKVEPAAGGKLKITGDLTIHGVTKEVVLNVDSPAAPIKDPWGNLRTGATATTKINRQDFGVKWNLPMEGGGVVVGDEVTITIDLEMVKKA